MNLVIVFGMLYDFVVILSTERMTLKRGPQMDKTVHRPLFFFKIAEIER